MKRRFPCKPSGFRIASNASLFRIQCTDQPPPTGSNHSCIFLYLEHPPLPLPVQDYSPPELKKSGLFSCMFLETFSGVRPGFPSSNHHPFISPLFLPLLFFSLFLIYLPDFNHTPVLTRAFLDVCNLTSCLFDPLEFFESSSFFNNYRPPPP